MSTQKQLRQDLTRQDLTIEDLVTTATRLLLEVAPKQTRYKVAERPDVRTIRYYTAQKLLPGPASYEGGRARYTGSHLLRLLVIKKMQAEHHTLRQIAARLQRDSDDELLRMLEADEPRSATLPARTVARALPPLAPAARPTEATPGASLRASALQRLQLAPGATLDVAEDLLHDPARRCALAGELEALARMLRQVSTEDTEGEDR